MSELGALFSPARLRALTIVGGSSSVHPSSPAAAWKQIVNLKTATALVDQ